jgi:nitrite reductase (NAD(P)H)
MAGVLSFNRTQAKVHSYKKFKRPDLSTRLKLLGVGAANFGDFLADRDGPKFLSGRTKGIERSHDVVKSLTDGPPPPPVKKMSYKDPFLKI